MCIRDRICGDLDPTRPYRPASPHSYTDLGNDQTSGDSHGGCYEKAYEAGIALWREKMREFRSVFHSEFGYHGPPRYESLSRFVPPEQIWPIGEAMEYHVQDNPYNTIPETFVQVQANMARALVGDFEDGAGFVKCASTLHAELLQAEMEHHRRRKWSNGGAMFWMFNDCWPCASWSAIDYYLVPKPAYYAAKRAAAPIITTWIEEEDRYDLHVVNDTLKPLACLLTLGQGRLGGKPRWMRKRRIQVDANTAKLVATIRKRHLWRQDNSYVFAKLTVGARTVATTRFFQNPWREMNWPEPGLTYRVSKARPVNGTDETGKHREYLMTVSCQTQNYARMVHLDGIEGPGVYLSDNFFDLMPHETRTVEIRSDHPLSPSQIRVRHWLDRWD